MTRSKISINDCWKNRVINNRIKICSFFQSPPHLVLYHQTRLVHLNVSGVLYFFLILTREEAGFIPAFEIPWPVSSIPSHPIQNTIGFRLVSSERHGQYLLLNLLWSPQILLIYLLLKRLLGADTVLGAGDRAESGKGTISSLKTSKAQRHTQCKKKVVSGSETRMPWVSPRLEWGKEGV